ncbi:hypothetical protein H9Q72_002331 [Fusarium xylarioides]|uniref:Uncharacterized protein n=1 Tax=Fusarium xylarioides TaxID=221167 RepID=A0A9P7I8U3_9HYPO|nr:hypothetical protein H9Q72_002331 [Fusarium xylarioides]
MITVILEGTPSPSFDKKPKTEPLRPPVPATLPVGHQEVMGRDKTLSHGQVQSTLDIANQIVESMNVIVKRYYLDREEGLKVKRRTQHAASTISVSAREYAAIRDAGMSKPLKHAAIALKYNLDLQEGIFGASSTGSDESDESSIVDGAILSIIETTKLRVVIISYMPRSPHYAWCSGLRRQRCWVHLTLRAKWAPFWRHYCEANELPYLPKYADPFNWAGPESGEKVKGSTGCRDEDDYEEQEGKLGKCGQLGVVRDEDDYEERVEGQIVRDEDDYGEQEDEAEENDSDTMEEDIIRTCLVDKERQTQTI